MCLEFCIELLNQKTKVHKYKSLLVCAMAVLDRGEKLWRDPENYLPIISYILKVAWFIEPAVAQVFITQKEISQTKVQKYFQQHINTKTNTLVFITIYYKGFYTSNNIKIIH
ncbi:hypothetical protein BJX63DRAFT_442415 [Aspergillus granulosus]|uniref:Uncharacterized protein n=1 Tax=Aspergillus granulosus TaxID=176169 RepID=A0ABR4GR64_9EURO